ncbi:MAG: type II/IV secretion system ATPase subunit, partial [Sulfolobales archaeon]
MIKKSSEGKDKDVIDSVVDVEPVKPIVSPERLRLSVVRGDAKLLETYALYEPWAYAYITEDLATGTVNYVVYEIGLTPQEESVYKNIVDYIMWELEPPKIPIEDVREYISRFARRAIRLFQLRLGRTPGLSWSKIGYYIERNIIGYGPIDPLMRDPNIEDISCNGPGIPVYVWHRRYEYLPTSVVFRTSQELDEFVVKLAHLAGKHISVAYPVLDAIIPGGHRVAATFQKEISTKGSTFTIRKFKEDPITIVDLVNYGTISPEIAAYFWLAMDFKMTTLILGVTGAGKTSTLNALANLLRPTYKIVTIEDTPELRLPQENWVQLTGRPSYLVSGVSEIKLYDLVKISLRYRPDVIIVGEVRGEEAYVLFQAIATGHSGITTLHAEDIDAAVKRLTSPPMNIPNTYIPLVNMALVIKRVTKLDETGRPRPVRRVTNIWEIEDYGKYKELASWDPVRDRFKVNLKESLIVERV